MQGESRLVRMLCLKVVFLLSSILSCVVFSIKCVMSVIFLWIDIDLQQYYDGPLTFYRMTLPIWTLGSVRFPSANINRK